MSKGTKEVKIGINYTVNGSGTGYKKTDKTKVTMMCEVRHEQNNSIMASGKFKKACEIAGIPVTRRQASKWNNSKGAAYARRNATK